ncbi:MAG: DevR family CRISPR-associated autoregulator [Candidatus Freyarchaeota archaeon]|nr:DevR family CRISPR-associated autoregulator [Candidatus Jordarchaeia archaeon]MBS7268227.1 DevR family CRISPR-associated autoregulator [Candidatus Jordarchaeia archaeon]MBS7279335.1 DevR family CRISPR-associated autoregulator [Candidatus Jordarchaeia archaeon]
MSKVYEISILGRAVWDLHSLNNEGTVGNVTEPRTVVLADGTKTDGISGEMLKHIHVAKMWELEKNKKNLCEACQVLEPTRIDRVFQKMKKDERKEYTFEKAASKAISECAICDLHGFLVQTPTGARPSTIEFGWALGIPKIYRDIHVHARHALGEKAREKGAGKEAVETTQMLYHRPTRSGMYAIVSLFQPWRIGLNNVNFEYNIEPKERKRRYELALKAYQAMFLRMDGAMTTTRLPHLEDFEGVIVVSNNNFPAPVVSPLNNGYKEKLKGIQSQIDTFEILEFNSISDFVNRINEISGRDIYSIGDSK